MNDGDVKGRTHFSAAERIVKLHGGTYSTTGGWGRAHAEEAKANEIAASLRANNFQVRSVLEQAKGRWEVLFR